MNDALKPTFQSALKVKIMHQYAQFLHVLMRNDGLNASMQKR